ncbi:MAG: ferric reductase-like transmembrane domain-containing protein [Candidatus Komeilibacteria bacterium]|nr:ferric reductase-like transmembrane domain-containing protein [Candidatus Komeilibacteria bacterium]
MDEKDAQQTTDTTVISTSPTLPAKKKFDPAGWPFFIKFSIGSLVFYAVEVAYQYYILTTQDVATSIVRGSALAGTTLIAAALFSSAVFRWVPQWAQYWHIRRYLGVAGALAITAHVLGVSYYYLGFDYTSLFFTLNPVENPMLFGVIGFIIIFAMLLTSNDKAMRMLGRNWKRLHKFVYGAFAAIILHFTLIRADTAMNAPRVLLYVMTALAVFGQLYWFFKTVYRKRFRSVGTVVGFAIIISFLILLWAGLNR